jgi:putative xylitol transport system permease protein
VLVLILVLLGSLVSPIYRSQANAVNVLRQASTPGLLVIGQTITMLGAGIDLSVAGVVKLTSILTAGIINGDQALVLPVVGLCLVIGALVGLANGLVVTRLKVPPFIATLGTASILRGISLSYTTTAIGRITRSVRQLYYGNVLGFPNPTLVFIAASAVAAFVLSRTRFGRYVYATGGSDEVAAHAGIDTQRVRILTYVISGVLAAVGGLIAASRMGVGDPQVGDGLEMDSITAAILGGVSLFGGQGSLLGAIGGVFSLSLANNLMNILQVSVWYQRVLKGLIVVLAVAAYKQRKP